MKTKNLLLSVVMLFGLSSCGTLFTSSNQYITLKGEPNAKVYDKAKLLGETDADGEASVKLKKSLYSKKLTIKKEGFKNEEVKVDALFNPISVINLTNVIAWAVDLGTGKCCKYDESDIVFSMEKK
ncbi:MAG: hypothetical protein IKL35_01990 [Muribaculaceae bacterium]|nr:hypothetical protein [Muribaculaceae bacterium]